METMDKAITMIDELGVNHKVIAINIMMKDANEIDEEII